MANSSRESLDVNPYLLVSRDRSDEEPVNDSGGGRDPEGVDLNYYRPLYLAALKGDWNAAQTFIRLNPSALTANVSILSMNALHVAAYTGQARFVEHLVREMPPEELVKVEGRGYTALHYAAMGGSKRMAKALITENANLTKSTDVKGRVPLLIAAGLPPEDKELVKYLCIKTEEIFCSSPSHPDCPFTGRLAGQLICFLTRRGFLDISLYLLHRYPNLATANHLNGSLLRVLALEPSNFFSGRRPNFLLPWIYHYVPVEVNYLLQENLHQNSKHPLQLINYSVPGVLKRVREEKLKHKCALELVKLVCRHVSRMDNHEEILMFFAEQSILTLAARSGIIEIVRECLQIFPDLIPINQRSLMQVAVDYRQEKIFRHISERIAFTKTEAFLSDESNNILHVVAKLAPYPGMISSISNPALHMHRELEWFKAVENFVPLSLKEMRLDGRTAWDIFIEEHKTLREDGEKWMKKASSSCMLVATLIATVAFAAAFNIPGGNDVKGTPNFLRKNSLMLFASFDALALFSSITYILVFLSILTSRYALEDFRVSLPKRLLTGLYFLFVAIAATMGVFVAAFFIAFGERSKWIMIPIVWSACFPVSTFALLQHPLVVEIFKSPFQIFKSEDIFMGYINRRLGIFMRV